MKGLLYPQRVELTGWEPPLQGFLPGFFSYLHVSEGSQGREVTAHVQGPSEEEKNLTQPLRPWSIYGHLGCFKGQLLG